MNRRHFIKWAGAFAAGGALASAPGLASAAGLPPEDQVAGRFVAGRRGRVLAASVTVFDRIESPHTAVKRYRRGDVILLGEERDVPGTGSAYNSLWYETRGGWVHSGWIQPMDFHSRPVIYRQAGPHGFWVEVIEPTATAREEPSSEAAKDYDYVYGTVYLVTDVAVDAASEVWYQTYDEYADKDLGISATNHWVQARHVRRIHESEFMAIRPAARDKRIVVDLKAQTLTCLEGDREVLRTKIASGAAFRQADGSVVSFATPGGDHQVILKQPSRHMRAIEAERNTDAWFDLPGVPWNTFFTYEGIAIHGTYWHNDFGVVRSHGCVNVPIPVAKFIYRWTIPTAPYTDAFVRADVRGMSSTRIEVA